MQTDPFSLGQLRPASEWALFDVVNPADATESARASGVRIVVPRKRAGIAVLIAPRNDPAAIGQTVSAGR